MSDFLAEMAQASAHRARDVRESAAISGLRARVESAPPPRPLQVGGGGFDVIAEPKLASPSRGRLVDGNAAAAVVGLATAFVDAGAIAISVLTEESRFRGSVQHLQAVSSVVEAPVMRKDFLVDPIQIDETRAAGASGVLLIARILPESLLVELVDQALSLGLFALIEVFDRSDLETAAGAFDREVLVGVNCRDLATLHVDRGRYRALAPHLPDRVPAVAESGIESGDDAAAVSGLGYRLALVGTSLVTAERPGDLLGALLESGRSVLARSR